VANSDGLLAKSLLVAMVWARYDDGLNREVGSYSPDATTVTLSTARRKAPISYAAPASAVEVQALREEEHGRRSRSRRRRSAGGDAQASLTRGSGVWRGNLWLKPHLRCIATRWLPSPQFTR